MGEHANNERDAEQSPQLKGRKRIVCFQKSVMATLIEVIVTE
jgi:hypothetical protein